MFGLFKRQIAYTVHEKAEPAADREERAEQLIFVREGFSLFAFIIAPLWMLVNRLWLVLILYVLVAAAAQGLITLFEIPDHWRYYATLAINLLVAFEADALQRWTLDRRNWRMVGSVSGANYEECERRFFEGWVPDVPMVAPQNFDKPGAFEAAAQAQPVHHGTVMPPKPSGWRSAAGWSRS